MLHVSIQLMSDVTLRACGGCLPGNRRESADAKATYGSYLTVCTCAGTKNKQSSMPSKAPTQITGLRGTTRNSPGACAGRKVFSYMCCSADVFITQVSP